MINVRGNTVELLDTVQPRALSADDLLDRLQNVTQRSEDQWAACCPAHDDRIPSLSIREAEDRVLLYCHAGCTYEEILDALGLESRDLSVRRIVDRYVYTNENGAPLSFKNRYEPKSFRQGHWESTNPKPVWHLKGVRRVLYRLPDVLAAVAHGELVHITEGEKDVHAIEVGGGVATTAPGSWRPEYSAVLRGADVRIVADRDEEGRKKALKVFRSLQGVARSVEIVEARWGKDAADHLEAGYTLADLVTVDWAPEASANISPATGGRRLKVTYFDEIEEEVVEWLWPGVVPQGKLTLLIGDPGHGKSLVTVDIAARLTAGRAMPDGTIWPPANVLMAFLEDNAADTMKPRLRVASAEESRVGAVTMLTKEGADTVLTFPDDVDALWTYARQHDVRLLIVDPITAFLGDDVNAWRDHDVRRALAPLQLMAADTGCAVLGVMHLSKKSGTPALYRALNSVAFTATARSVYLVGPLPDDDDHDGDREAKVFVRVKGNLSAPTRGRIFRLTVPPGEVVPRIEWGEEADLTADQVVDTRSKKSGGGKQEIAQRLLVMELAKGPRPAQELYEKAAQLGIAKRTLSKVAQETGIRRWKDGYKDAPWMWCLADRGR